MKRLIAFAAVLLTAANMMAETKTVSSPDGRLVVTIEDNNGQATYSVTYDNSQVLQPSRLGLETNYADFTQGLTITQAEPSKTIYSYEMRQTKTSIVRCEANRLAVTFQNTHGQEMIVRFHVSNHDIAYCYQLLRPKKDNPKCAVISREVTSFRLPDGTKTFLTPQISPMTGWERTKPSYEEDYKVDQPMAQRSQFGQGYTFPCLFKAPLLSPLGGTASPKGNNSSPRGEAGRGLAVAVGLGLWSVTSFGTYSSPTGIFVSMTGWRP